MSVNLSAQNLYKDVERNVPRYRYARIPLNNLPSGQVVFTPTSVQLMEWKLPTSTAFNISRSFVSGTVPYPALAGNFLCTFEDVGGFWRQAYFGNGSGLGLVDVNFSDAYCQATLPMHKSVKETLSGDQLEQFYACNQPSNNNILPFSRDGLTAGTENASSVSYLEKQYLSIAPVANTAVTRNYLIPLSNLKDSFMSSDKDVIFGNDMYLRLWSLPLQRMCYYTTSPANPSANVTAITSNVTVSNVYLYLAIEENLTIRQRLLEDLESGRMKMSIQYPYCYRFSVAGNSASANLSLTLTKNYGRNIKKIILIPSNGGEYTNLAFDHSNLNGTKVTTLQTTIDGRPLTDYPIACYNPNSSLIPTGTPWTAGQSQFADDYREMRKYIDGTALMNYNVYQTNWIYQDCWGIPPSNSKDIKVPIENLTEGFDLLKTGDHVFAITAQTPFSQQATSNTYTNGMIFYLFCIFTRTLVIQPGGITFEP